MRSIEGRNHRFAVCRIELQERAKAGLAARMTNELHRSRWTSALIQKERESHVLQVVGRSIHSHDRAPHFFQRASEKNPWRVGCICPSQKSITRAR